MTALDPIRNGRLLLYPAEVLLNTDLLRAEIFRMVDISMLAQTIIGGWPTPTTIAAGLNCTPTVTPPFSVTIASGVIYQFEELDATDYPSDGSGLAADATQICKQGINLDSTQINSLNPSGVGGESIAYLIQAELATIDTESTTRQYYNPVSPNVPITLTKDDLRQDIVSLTTKASASGVTPTIPTPDAGHIGLWVVTVPNGATVITSGMIAPYSANSFVSETLPQKVSYQNLQKSAPLYSLDTSVSANTITADGSVPAYVEYAPGTYIIVKAANNNTGATTINVNGLGSRAVQKATDSGLVALQGGEIITGVIYEFFYDGTQFQLLNPSSGSAILPGMMIDFGGGSVPGGYLPCDGASLLRASYPALFAAIGTTWGAADGTHFNVPDFRRRTAVGSGGSSTGVLGNVVGDTGGEETHTLTIAEMPSHDHPGSTVDGKDPGGSGQPNVSGSADTNFAVPVNVAAQGDGDPHNIMQPSAVVTKIIKI